jgi:selenocysteine lyase/cysteine desulfurase
VSAPITDDDIAAWRLDTPGCAARIHLNNAGAGLMPMPVVDAIERHLHREASIGGYEAAAEADAALARTYDDLAVLVGAAPRNIAIRSSATAAFIAAMSAFDLHVGDAVVTSQNDYISHQLAFLSMAERLGVRVVRVPDAPEGGIDLDVLAATIARERPRFVALTWIPTNSGLIQPAADVGAICAQAGVPFLLDACQAVGQLPIDVGRLQCDYLATTARKFLRGPRGIGVLVVSDAALARGDAPLHVDMRGAEWSGPDRYALVDSARRFEEWEVPYALVLGFGAAARYALEAGVPRTAARAHALAAEARRRCGEIPGFVPCDVGTHRAAIVSLAIDGVDAATLVPRLRARGINTSAHSVADAAIDMPQRGLSTTLRVSPHYYNTLDELTILVDTLRELLGRG